MKRLFRQFKEILSNIYCIIKYLCYLLYSYVLILPISHRYFKSFPLKKNANKGKTISIFANGPSLKKDLERVLTDDEFKNVDFSVMNYFGNDPLFEQIKPKYYCLWDPQFFRADERYDKVMQLMQNINNNTTWPMTLFIGGNVSRFKKFSGISNPNIKIVPLAMPTIDGSRKLKNFFYRSGWALPLSHTVAIINMFTAIQMGYEYIRLYGADTSLLDGICVNEKNQACTTIKHFDDKTKVEIKPITEMASFHGMRLAGYIEMVLNIVKGHDDIAEYAESLGVKCLNCCKGSMLDCYPRKIFSSDQKEN